MVSLNMNVRLLLIVALLASALSAPAQSTGKTGSDNEKIKLYATNVAWRSITNQIATLNKDIRRISQPLEDLREKRNAKVEAKQSTAAEDAQIKAVYDKTTPLEKKVAALKADKLEMEQRMNAVQYNAAQKSKAKKK
jgi:hypothetical protein